MQQWKNQFLYVAREVNSGKKSCRRFQKSADVEDYSVNASIITLNGFSAHADQKKLLQWAEALPQR